MSPSLLQVEAVTVRFGGIVALSSVDVAVDAGEVVGVVGALGAGKSTLLRVAAGALRPDSGTVSFDGAELGHLPPGEAGHRGLLLVTAGGGIFPTLTVAENLRLASPSRRPPSTQVRRELFDHFPILAERPGQLAGSLSGGEQRQLALARARLASPRVLFLDEPLLGLAPQVAAAVAALVRQVADSGCAVLMVEERPSDVLSALVVRLVGLRLGRVVAAGADSAAERADIDSGDRRSHATIEAAAVRVPLSVDDKRALQTLASARGETVGELLARVAREHVAVAAEEVGR